LEIFTSSTLKLTKTLVGDIIKSVPDKDLDTETLQLEQESNVFGPPLRCLGPYNLRSPDLQKVQRIGSFSKPNNQGSLLDSPRKYSLSSSSANWELVKA